MAICANAQKGNLKFQSTTHDFGVMNKKKTPDILSYSFQFVNDGKSVVTIKKVVCSETYFKIDYPKSPIQPNEKGAITVNIDKSHLWKTFIKNIAILSDGEKPLIHLQVRGNFE